MPVPSTIDRLPEDIKLELQRLLQNPRITQLDVTARINEILEADGHPERVTKSSVNRYAVKMNEAVVKVRQANEMAEMWIARFGSAPQGKIGAVVMNLLTALSYDITMKLNDTDFSDPEAMAATIDQVQRMALTIQRLEQSASLSVKREAEIRKQAGEQVLAQLDGKQTITADEVRKAIREGYGV